MSATAAPIAVTPVTTAPVVMPPLSPVEDEDDDENGLYLAYQLAMTQWSIYLGTLRPQPPPGYAAYLAATAGNHTAFAGASEVAADKAPAKEEQDLITGDKQEIHAV
ncbi:hypothetical protein DXG01_011520 [Tephrocybe rancida]|nr:hypothetical protein DXG01_011520 [Tephrocybe rancida]